MIVQGDLGLELAEGNGKGAVRVERERQRAILILERKRPGAVFDRGHCNMYYQMEFTLEY